MAAIGTANRNEPTFPAAAVFDISVPVRKVSATNCDWILETASETDQSTS
ncbi:hypothetical protein GCM10025786_36260 [Nocardioides caeni]|jgi:hypothetical protein